MAASSTKDLDLLAYSLISQFLTQHNLTDTLATLQTEAPASIYDDLQKHRVPHKPLTAILEEYDLLTAQDQLGSLSITQQRQQVKRDDDELFALGRGRVPIEPSRVYDTIHLANIVAAATVTLPSNLFPAAELAGPNVPVLVTASTDKTIRVSHKDSGKLLGVLDHQKAACLALDFYPPDKRFLLTAGMNGSHHVADLTTEAVAQSFSDHAKYVVRALFSPDGAWFATGSYDRSVSIYKRTTDAGVIPPKFEKVHTAAFPGAVESLCFLPTATDPPTLVIGSRDSNYLNYLTLDPSRAYPTTRHNMNANGDDWISFTAMDLRPSPTGHHLACYTDSKAGRIIIFRTHSTIQARNLWGVVADGFSQPRCCWDSSGRLVFATSDDMKVYVFDVPSGQVVKRLEGHTGVVRGLGYDGERQQLVSCSFDRTVRVWETSEDGDEGSISR
ncbi:WD40-repeat-containing domain protein [Fimicolochytrium jonesii]|uniref:WD40-repeat-containing domain protein n=1 Tax=Fimicolochytrium jonesii TaxID=1396493 RepID=UPI0022FDD013|nr:WD40-repeat-containing domain protein [Fimicolochytrium jonesii]KAI8824040.1 WD40-repeat-containing domain protein [Fimicolochytrium jonesii]